MWLAKVKVSYIIVHPIDTEQPFAGSGIDRAIEIVHVHETTVLRCRKDPTEIIVTEIQIIVVTIYSAGVTGSYIIHNIAHIVYKIIVHLVYIIILHSCEVQFIGHTICQEAGMLAHLTHAHRTHCRNAYGKHQQHHPKGSQFLHNIHVLELSIFLWHKNRGRILPLQLIFPIY